MAHINLARARDECDNNSTKAELFARTGSTFYDQFEQKGALIHLEKAIMNQQQAVSLTPDYHPDKPTYLNSLGSSLGTRFMRKGILSDLDEAIKNQQQSVSLIPDGHPEKPMYLNNLGISFGNRFGHTGVLSDLEEAIGYQRQAVSLIPVGHPGKPLCLSSLGNSLRTRFRYMGALSDLEGAIKLQQKAVSLTPDDHPQKPMYLNSLGISFESLFGHTGALNDLEKAITNTQKAVSLTPDGDPDRPRRYNSLGISFGSRFRHTESLDDLEAAITNQRQAVLLTPDGHPNKPGYLNNLGSSFGTRFLHIGTLTDLEEAIKYQQQTVLLTPDGHPEKPMYLGNLGISFGTRFRRIGILSDLDEAIKYQQQALLLTPDNHTHKPSQYNSLGISFGRRFQRTGALGDLEAEIRNQQQAVSRTSDGHPDKPIYLNSLGISFGTRFRRTGTPSDLEEAIKTHQQAVSLTLDGHLEKPRYLTNLGISFGTRFKSTGALGDLEDAITNQQLAVSLTPDSHPDKPIWLDNLGISLESRFGRTGALSDLEEAIKYQRQTVSIIPDGHADRPMYLVNLGTSIESRFGHTKSSNDLDEAISHFQSAATSNIGSPSLRSHASRRWARLEAKRDPPSALFAYRRAIDLIAQVAWIGDPIDTRHSQLKELGDIPREAAAFALDFGHSDLALEWLEQGRSVVWNQLLSLRASIHDLHQAHPDICIEFTQVSQELQSAVTRGRAMSLSDNANISLEEETRRHHRLAEKWDSLVEKIRSLPDFEDFLLPKKVSVLKKAASSGPIVVINAHQLRCDALVLEQGRDKVLHIPLNNLRYEDVENMRKSMRQYLANPRHAQRWTDRAGAPVPVSGPRMAGVLERIYSVIVDPILRGLGLAVTGSDAMNLPHIWWCPTGPLTFLPLHAACRKVGTRMDGIFNFAVSSYTPTVNALLEARAVKPRPFNQLVGIAMTDTPGQSALPGADTEIAKITGLFSSDRGWKFEVLRNEQATGERVLTRMASSSWIHLACHAIQDVQEPTRSGFCLHDRRLAITDIIAKPFANADLAFLSACETATGDEKALDEAVHITGAMLGAGYRSIIGTMWSIPDEAAPVIA